mgnify:CR=1 FL=1
MCLTESYHGETMGALAVGSMDLFAKMYQPMLMETIHTEAPDCFRCPYNKTRETCGCECFEHMEENFAKHSHELAAVIVEPIVQGCAGMRIYPPLYLKNYVLFAMNTASFLLRMKLPPVLAVRAKCLRATMPALHRIS